MLLLGVGESRDATGDATGEPFATGEDIARIWGIKETGNCVLKSPEIRKRGKQIS